MIDKSMPSKTVGTVSATFITKLQQRGKTIFSSAEAMEIYGKNRYATGDFLSELVKRGILARVKAGVYLLLQAGSEDTQLTNWPVIARELTGKAPYFISHYSAMRIHGMTTHPLNNVFLTLIQRKHQKSLSGISYHFIYSKKEHFWGHAAYWATKQEQVRVSDPERTLLDGFDRPELCGGITDVVRGIWAAQKKIDFKKLERYAARYRTKAAVKRLGFVLETLKIAPDLLPGLAQIIQRAGDYSALDPQGPKEGKHLKRWGIRLNLDPEELKAGVWG
jgi:predicted transcriptional regulator of viral defense system